MSEELLAAAPARAVEPLNVVQQELDGSENGPLGGGDGAPLAFDPGAARKMLEMLAAPYMEAGDVGRFEIVGFHADKEKKLPPFGARHFDIRDLDAMVSHAALINAMEGYGVYVGAGLRGPDAPPEGRASARHVLWTRWLRKDFDQEGAAEPAMERLNALKLTPTFSVVTGTRPALRLQCWIQLDDKLDNRSAQQVMHGLARKLGGDPSITSASHVMRLAGSIAWPKPHKQGRVAEMVRLMA